MDRNTERSKMIDHGNNKCNSRCYILPVHTKEIAINSLAAVRAAANDDSFKSDSENNHE